MRRCGRVGFLHIYKSARPFLFSGFLFFGFKNREPSRTFSLSNPGWRNHNFRNCKIFSEKIHRLTEALGLHKHKMRLRQSKNNEVPHYAKNAWNLEVYIGKSKIWIECIKIVDRKEIVIARRALDKPISEKVLTPKFNKNIIRINEYILKCEHN